MKQFLWLVFLLPLTAYPANPDEPSNTDVANPEMEINSDQWVTTASRCVTNTDSLNKSIVRDCAIVNHEERLDYDEARLDALEGGNTGNVIIKGPVRYFGRDDDDGSVNVNKVHAWIVDEDDGSGYSVIAIHRADDLTGPVFYTRYDLENDKYYTADNNGVPYIYLDSCLPPTMVGFGYTLNDVWYPAVDVPIGDALVVSGVLYSIDWDNPVPSSYFSRMINPGAGNEIGCSGDGGSGPVGIDGYNLTVIGPVSSYNLYWRKRGFAKRIVNGYAEPLPYYDRTTSN